MRKLFLSSMLIFMVVSTAMTQQIKTGDSIIVIDQANNSKIQIHGDEILFVDKDKDSTRIYMSDSIRVISKPEKTVVKIGKEEIIVIEEGNDTTRLKIGNRGITVIEGSDGTTFEMDKFKNYGQKIEERVEKEVEVPRDKKSKFKAHWAGVEWGINNFVNSDFSMSLDPESTFMDLRTSRSWNFNINFIEYGIPLGTPNFGLVTGMGLEFNNYHFTGNNNITLNDEDVVVEYLPDFLTNPRADVRKTKFQTTYLVAPLLLEGHIPAGKEHIYISAGIVGGLKIGSKTKMVYEIDGNKQKDKYKDDFNLSLLRYGFTARLGYQMLKVFATYYPTPLFENNKGPELYPFSLGLTLLSF